MTLHHLLQQCAGVARSGSSPMVAFTSAELVAQAVISGLMRVRLDTEVAVISATTMAEVSASRTAAINPLAGWPIFVI